MITYSVYSIRDVRTGFLTPTVEINDDVAVRNFSHAVQTGETVFWTHAADFALYRIGSFDVDTGRLTPEQLPVLVLEAYDVIRQLGTPNRDSIDER